MTVELTPNQRALFLETMKAAATAAGHKWPGAAAAEAADETGWGQHYPKGSNNVLGIKAFKGWMGKTVGAYGTEENPDGTFTGPQPDRWCVFASFEDCFAEQMVILQEPRYAAAQVATTVEIYIAAECVVWSTGILKGQAVLEIYRAHIDILGGK